MNFEIKSFNGPSAKVYFKELAQLRIEVFREYPYLYEGNLNYEKSYLDRYFECDESFLAISFIENSIVGATTAIPLKYEEDFVKKTYLDSQIEINSVVYFGESVIKKQFRGHGIGSEFFKQRIHFASKLPGIKMLSFCAVERKDVKAPDDYYSPESLWKRFGFEISPDMNGHYSWKDVGKKDETEKKMRYWIRSL